MQLANIAMGGDMIQDIEAIGKSSHRRIGTMDGMHKVEIVKASLLHDIIGYGSGTVNSAHHQAVGRIADAFVVNCHTSDGLVEGLEWKEKEGKNFFLGVQWHPERLANLQPASPMNRIRKRFIDEVARFKKS